MKKDRLTPRGDRRKINRSVSPQNVIQKGKPKECFLAPKNSNKQNDPSNSKDNHSIKICLDLASYHKKEAEQMKLKNESLEERLKEQSKDMEALKSQLQKIKVSIQSCISRKELDVLKTENSHLRADNVEMKQKIETLSKLLQQVTDENLHLKSKGKEAESVLIDSQSRYYNAEINSLTVAKLSRRQEYANKYENLSFVSSVRCLQCARKDNQLQEGRNKYSNELRQLQEQLSNLQRNQVAIAVMESQMMSKNECIDYLIKQLNCLQSDSQSILQNMTFLQRKLKDVAQENIFLKTRQGSDRLHHSFSKTVA